MEPPRPSRWCARPPMGGRAAVERLIGGALPAQPWQVPSPLPRAAARDLPTRLADLESTVVRGGRGKFFFDLIESPPSLFYPNLDLRARMALIPLLE
jgi:hypothetical protein